MQVSWNSRIIIVVPDTNYNIQNFRTSPSVTVGKLKLQSYTVFQESQPKQALDPFGRFWKAQPCDRLTDKSLYSNIGHNTHEMRPQQSLKEVQIYVHVSQIVC